MTTILCTFTQTLLQYYVNARAPCSFTLTHPVHSAEVPSDRTPLGQGMETQLQTNGVHLHLDRTSNAQTSAGSEGSSGGGCANIGE